MSVTIAFELTCKEAYIPTQKALEVLACTKVIRPGPILIKTASMERISRVLLERHYRILTPSDNILRLVLLQTRDGSSSNHGERSSDESDGEEIDS